MIGVILCGGQSVRMGTDKGLLTLQASTWAQTAIDKMAALPLQVVLSVNEAQYNNYAVAFPNNQLVKDNKTMDVKGPLCGLLSVHLAYPEDDLFILACDMPLMEMAILKQLFSHYEKQPADAYVYTNDGLPEPLCGIYKARALLHVLQLKKTNQLLKHSMKYMLEHITTDLTPLTTEQKIYFRNFNAHADLNGL
jgi:molybdenum cofactor guanylyltransferase